MHSDLTVSTSRRDAPPAPAARAASPVFTPVEAPPWRHRMLPRWLRLTLTDLGMWEPPTPQPASRHLTQVSACLTFYGWCQDQDRSPVGRLCIRGAQDVLERTGHVTPDERELAVHYMNSALQQAGVHMSFYTWNDIPEQSTDAVHELLRRASAYAFKEGD